MPHVTFNSFVALATLALCVEPINTGSNPAGRIDHIGDLQTPRSVHSSTLLPSGDLLIAGGMAAGGGSLASAEVVDVSRIAATTTNIASLATARSGHSATALPDGRVVLAGGYNGEYLASIEVFDPKHRAFTSLGRLQTGRSGHTATLMPDGKILLIGGVGHGWTFLDSAELFDPATGRSELVGSLHAARESHTASLLSDGRVLVVGGHRGRRAAMEVFAGSELYDPATRRFTPSGNLTTPRHKHDAVRLADGRVLVLAGADRTDRNHFASTEIYDPASGTFSAGPTMAHTRYKIAGTSVLLPDGNVLVPSGASRVELLHVPSQRFFTVPGHYPNALYFSTATLLPDGSVIIVGGYGEGVDSSRGVWRYRAAADHSEATR